MERIITKDFKNKCLIIKGDYAPSSITIYVITHRFSDKLFGFYLEEERAKDMCEYLRKKENSNEFFVMERTLFV